MDPSTSGNEIRPISAFSSFIFAVVAIAHLMRFVNRWDLIFNGRSIPFWGSAAAFVICALLAVLLLREATDERS